MDDALNVQDNNITKMGASSNVNIARITALQERKKQIEDKLVKRNQELRQLCIQEAELTGVTPHEMPLEPGETLPLIRRRVKTAFELPENLVVNSNKDTLITDLELQIQLHANLAQAALGLANEQNISKTVKRQHRSEYQKHKNHCIALQKEMELLKERAAAEQYKQKKKPRVPEQKDDTISVNTNYDPFLKSDVRHSIRSAKHNLPSSSEGYADQRYSQVIMRHTYRNPELHYTESQTLRQEEIVNSGFYRLSLNGYNKYMERREKVNSVHPVSNYNTYTNSIPYNLSHSSLQQHGQPHSPHFQQSSPHSTQQSPLMSQHNPHSSQHSPLASHHSTNILQQSPRFSQHNPHLAQQHSPQLLQYSPQLAHQWATGYGNPNYNTDVNKFPLGSNHFLNNQLHRQSSPPIPQKSQYFTSHTIHGQPNYRHYQNEGGYRNPHQIQPHQQYEHMGMMSMGLGGCWKKAENGELVWYNSNTIDVSWQKDKRFGSLDRRKNKRIHKRISPSIDHNSPISSYPDQVRTASVKSQTAIRRAQDNGQLVRTQSLGSVGIQTVDSVYPSDDNSSCASDNGSINDVNQILRKHKEKEWLETSLDGPVSLSQTSTSSLPPLNQSVLAPQEKYVVHSPPPPVPPLIAAKPPLEIPAESNPSPRQSETNLEIFNNNIPQNCTIVQAGHCKPYHEETKPFEMSDFYKYSTKFKKSPVKGENKNSISSTSISSGNVSRNLNETFEECPQNSYPTPVKPYSSNVGNLDNSGNLNSSIELGHITVSDHFSAEMNAWYKDQQTNNNNAGNVSKSRSTATLV